MGFGDEIMVTGEARRLQERDRRPIAVRGRDGRARWHPMWQGNPRIAPPAAVATGRDVQWCNNYPGHRPYVDYARTTKQRWVYTDWRCTPGQIYLSAEEAGFGEPWRGRDFVVVEPHVKATASPNKRWGLARTQAVVDAISGRDGAPAFVQFDWGGGPPLQRTIEVRTPSFRHACAVLAQARAYLGPEGGLHHAAAALGVPAVVIFGGMTAPANTGYDGHVNLFDNGPDSPCGRRVPCLHCERAMAAIRPEIVGYHLEHLLR
jgi:ADP-heptose:LPS heptosyltransferase